VYPRHLFVIIGIVLAASIAGCSGEAANDQAMPPPPDVSVATVAVREVSQWDEFTGRVEAVESVELRPRVSGYIERLNYIEGREVAKGDVLFDIDARTYRAALDLAEAELERARVQELLTQTELERARKLIESKAISLGEFDQRRATHAQAQANVRVAQAAVDVAALNLEFTKVRAPVAGRAGRALVTAGNLVSTDPNATLLTTIVSLDPVYVYFEGDEQTYLRYKAMSRGGERTGGREARYPVRIGLAGEDGYPHPGELDFVDNRVDPSTGTIRARALVPNRDRILTPGLFARVQLLAGDPFEAMLIDDKAILTDQDRKYVYVVGDDGLAMRRDIRTGRLIDGLRVVESGLAAGDRVIVHGVQKVFFPGMPVQAHEVAMGDPPPPPGPPGGMAH
jgi:membrane fusion protein, multidrug efflux system